MPLCTLCHCLKSPIEVDPQCTVALALQMKCIATALPVWQYVARGQACAGCPWCSTVTKPVVLTEHEGKERVREDKTYGRARVCAWAGPVDAPLTQIMLQGWVSTLSDEK